MWIVRLALRRPYTFVVMAVLIAILGGVAIYTTPTDIFPVIDIPVVSVIWSYSGISPEEMERRVVTVSERAFTTTVNDIEHMESQSLNGVSVIRVFFQPDAKVELSIAQLNSITGSLTRILPPGIFPPSIVKYNASSVPILQLALDSPTMSETQLYDYGLNFIRTQLATVQGAAVPLPYGGKPRSIMVDINPDALFAKGLSATDVSNALTQQNLILPAGTVKVAEREYNVRLNSSPEIVDELNNIPLKQVKGAIVYMRDVAQVRDGFSVQNNVVRQNGRRSALLTVLKTGTSSTLTIIDRVRATLKRIKTTLPPEMNVTELFDQSLFVRAAIQGVVQEALIAAGLTALMIVLFLGSWRSTVIVCISIPLSILTSLVFLKFLGQTINVMTLGGLALAVGILVDDATVAIENIHRNMGMKKSLVRAILDGSQQIAIPAFVSTLAICIVFVPVVFLKGAAKYLFTPLAMAVVFAMLMSYLLSRTLVPTMADFLLKPEVRFYQEGEDGHAAPSGGFFWHIHYFFNAGFIRMRHGYQRALDWCLHHRAITVVFFAFFFIGSMALLFQVGEDFFPTVDSGQMRLHVRAPSGTRIEETERILSRVEASIRRKIPPDQLKTILDNIGLPQGGINLAYSDSSSIGSGDAEILISLDPERHRPTAEYIKLLRRELYAEFPELTFFFQPANITNQILNFGLPAPIDVQVMSRDKMAAYNIARQLEKQMAAIPGAVDVHLHQVMDYPEIKVNVDRLKAAQIGMTQRDVANSLLISLSSSGQVAPNFWLNPINGVNYFVSVQTPQYRIDSFDALARTPITTPAAQSPQLLSNLATFERSSSMAVVNHYNVQPVFDIFANIQDRDLGSVASAVTKILSDAEPKLPRGVFLDVRGQVETMESSFTGLGFGLMFAVILVYLLMVVNFQSWLDPFIIMMALPGALSGILWMLFVSQTTLSVPSLMGAIMTIGVATANSILLVTFANDQRAHNYTAIAAALSAGVTRIRPVLMTALAMIIGMLPMSLGLGEGGEQNAPLARAVIGGLLLATVSTLFFVPVVYSYLRRQPPKNYESELQQEDAATQSSDRESL
jgi:CzcA family heavy metal efflux pump